MCLSVKEVPTSKAAGAIVPCWKYLTKNDGKLVTGYMDYPLPSDGWLFPKKQSKKKELFNNDIVDVGWIHAMTYCNQHGGGPDDCSRKAYAFLVGGYEETWGLVCRGLFIPSIDEDNASAKATEKRISKLVKRWETLRQRDLMGLHPELDKVIKKFW